MREPEIQKGAASTFLIVSVLALAGYLGVSTLQGNNGLFRLLQIRTQEEKLQTELLSLRDERREIEVKTQNLSDIAVDPDLLEEQAQHVLGLTNTYDTILSNKN